MDFYTGSLRPNMGPELVLRTGPSLAFQISLNLQSLQAVNLYPRHLYDVLWVHLGLIEEDILPRSFLA